MFTFPIMAVRKVIDYGIADAANNGGFRNPFYGMRPGEGGKPGLWLVSDQGSTFVPTANSQRGNGRSSSIWSNAIRSAIPTGLTASTSILAVTTAWNSLRLNG